MDMDRLEAGQDVGSLYRLQQRVPDTFAFNSANRRGQAERERLSRITVTLPKSLTAKLNAYRDSFRISVSSIVEHAVWAYLERGCAQELIEDLRARGASLHRE